MSASVSGGLVALRNITLEIRKGELSG